MSVIALATVKSFLRVTHDSDDALLQTLLDGAEMEAMRFLNRSELPGAAYSLPEDSSSEPDVDTETAVAADVVIAVAILVQMDYEADSEERPRLRMAAESKLTPYRTEMGV